MEKRREWECLWEFSGRHQTVKQRRNTSEKQGRNEGLKTEAQILKEMSSIYGAKSLQEENGEKQVFVTLSSFLYFLFFILLRCWVNSNSKVLKTISTI